MADDKLIKEIVARLEYFDIESYLESRRVEFWTEGKNVTRGWINIKCPWCPDPSNHLGINLSNKKISCWICSVKGTAIKLISKIDRCSFKNVLQTVKKFSSVQYNKEKSLDISDLTERKTQVSLPIVAKRKLLPIYRAFLEQRGFNTEHIFNKYDLLCNGPIGKYKHRLIVPFYKNKRLVTFSARDVTGRAAVPYINHPIKESILSTKETLYNIDNCFETALVLEGFIDVWKVGDGACATMGTKWTAEQASLLYSFKRVLVLFDTEPEAQENAEKLCFDLSSHIPHPEVLELDAGDPGDMNEDDINHLRKEVFGKIY